MQEGATHEVPADDAPEKDPTEEDFLDEVRQVRELMAVDGQEFPKTWWDGEAVPEAWSYDQRRLPHLQAEEHKLFPKATAVADAGDEDPAERCILEDRCQAEGEPTTTNDEPNSSAIYRSRQRRHASDESGNCHWRC